ncbi:TPA: hypothetical protein ACH3X3_012664 [Trebouxia sp. C0006]
MTRAKAEAASDQCPLVIKWLKWAVLEELDCAAHVPYSVGEGDYQQRQAWEADSEKMRFKPPNDHPAFRNLVGTVYDDTMLTQDYGIVGQNSNNVCKTVKPAYLKASATDMRNSLDSMGIRTKEQVRIGGKKRRNMIVPFHRRLRLLDDEEGSDDRQGSGAARDRLLIANHRTLIWIFMRYRLRCMTLK